MRVKPESLRRLANKLPSSVIRGALQESADYIENLENQLSELCPIADLSTIESLNMEKSHILDNLEELKIASVELIKKLEELSGSYEKPNSRIRVEDIINEYSKLKNALN